jgi:hypothetical protein
VSKGGTDSSENLTYLCPNCHRKAHNGLLKYEDLKSFAEVVGDRWKEHYNVSPRIKAKRQFCGKVLTVKLESLEKGRMVKAMKRAAKAESAVAVLRKSQIDKTRYGWIEEAARALDIAPQSVVRYLKRYDPTFLDGAKLRRKTH